MKYFTLLFSVFFAISCQEIEMIKGPPSQVRLMINDNPSQNLTLIWNSNGGKSDESYVFLDTTDHGDNLELYKKKFSPDYSKRYRSMDNTYLRLKNLLPKTKYFFLIQNSWGVTKRFYFETLSDQNSEISLIAGGDSRNNRMVRQDSNVMVSKLYVDAVLFGGDMTGDGSSSRWKNWLDDWQLTIAADGRITPLIVARGNHEKNDEMLEILFDTPQKVFYGITFGENLLRAYVLNTETSIYGNQTEWLKNDLEKNQEHHFKMAIYHRPMRPHVSSKSEGNAQYKNWASLFYTYQFDFVVESDSHVVKATWPIKPDSEGDEGFIRDDASGTIYVGEGGWGAPLRNNDDNKDWTRSSASFNQFKWIFIRDNQIELRTVYTNNSREIKALSENSKFEIPENLKVWKMNDSDVIRIEH